jgi:hypothetical protein
MDHNASKPNDINKEENKIEDEQLDSKVKDKENIVERVIIKREVIPIQLALAIVIAIVSVITTFFVTRAGLNSRIDSVSSNIERIQKRLDQPEIQKYLERTKLYTQITNLKILESELERLEKFVDLWKPFRVKFGKKIPYSPTPLTFDVIIEVISSEGGPPTPYDHGLIGHVASSVETRGIPDTDIMPRTNSIVLRINKYNAQIMNLRIGLPKGDAQTLLSECGKDIQFLKSTLPGLRQKVIDDRNEINHFLSKKKVE